MKRITTILMILCTVMAMLPSCEKFNPEEPDNTEIPDNPETPDNPNIPDNPTDPITKDGVIQKTGLVDLGLSVKWAACDLGGDGVVKDCSVNGYSKYWSTVQISAPPAEIGGTSFDWATSILGEQWQTPSKAQWEELKEKCRISYAFMKIPSGGLLRVLQATLYSSPLELHRPIRNIGPAVTMSHVNIINSSLMV